jgi:hypothetical protein
MNKIPQQLLVCHGRKLRDPGVRSPVFLPDRFDHISGKHKIVAREKLWFSFLFFMVWVVKLVQSLESLKVASSKNFLFGHYWLFTPEPKSNVSNGALETILYFPEYFTLIAININDT